MNYYNLLPEPEETKKFLELLPEHGLNECLTVALFIRKKYAKDNPEFAHLSLSNDDGCWERTIVSHTKRDRDRNFQEKVYRAILAYCRPQGAWSDRLDQPLPENMLALYMSVNPRCAIKGTRELITDLNRDCFLASSEETPFVGNLVSRAKTKIQKNASRKLIADIDIDVKDESILNRFRDLINLWGAEVCTIETRGGYHILCDIQQMGEANKKWFPDLVIYANEFNENGKACVEVKSDTLAPIPGSRQAGHVVKLI